jgi:hypothetical protein
VPWGLARAGLALQSRDIVQVLSQMSRFQNEGSFFPKKSRRIMSMICSGVSRTVMFLRTSWANVRLVYWSCHRAIKITKSMLT